MRSAMAIAVLAGTAMPAAFADGPPMMECNNLIGLGSARSDGAARVTGNFVDVIGTSSSWHAVRDDGSVVQIGVSWGQDGYVLPSSDIRVKAGRGNIVCNDSGYCAAIVQNGTIAVWGLPMPGYDDVKDKLSTLEFTRLWGAASHFLAETSDGDLVTWRSGGSENIDLDSTSVHLAAGIKEMIPNNYFLAVTNEDAVVAFGSYVGDFEAVADSLGPGVKQLVVIPGGSVAINSTDGVNGWGANGNVAHTSPTADRLAAIVAPPERIVATGDASFAVFFPGGQVVAFGHTSLMPTDTDHAALASGVEIVFCGHANTACAARMSDGSVTTWGTLAGDISTVAAQLTNVVNLTGTDKAFAVLKADGSVVAWGDAEYGGDATTVASLLASDVVQVVGTDSLFAALRADGRIVSWKDGFAYDTEDAAKKLALAGVHATELLPTQDDVLVLTNDTGVVLVLNGLANDLHDRRPAAIVDIEIGRKDMLGLYPNAPPNLLVYFDSGRPAVAGYRKDILSPTPGVPALGATSSFTSRNRWSALDQNGQLYTYGPMFSSTPVLDSPVKQVVGTGGTGIVLYENGNVVTFGHDTREHHDLSTVQAELVNVVKVFLGFWFAGALRSDGKVVTWGERGVGLEPHSNVVDILADGFVAVAIDSTGTLLDLGSEQMYSVAGSDAASGSGNIVGPTFYRNSNCYAILRESGHFESWGSCYLDDTVKTEVAGKISKLYGGTMYWIFLLNDGTIRSDGNQYRGGDTSGVSHLLVDVREVHVGDFLKVAIVGDAGAAVTWGYNLPFHENSADVIDPPAGVNFTGVDLLFTTAHVAALHPDGNLYIWGNNKAPSILDLSTVSSLLGPGEVRAITANYFGYAALRKDGRLVTFSNQGQDNQGTDSAHLYPELASGVVSVHSHPDGYLFAALKDDGQVIVLGKQMDITDSAGFPRLPPTCGLVSLEAVPSPETFESSSLVLGTTYQPTSSPTSSPSSSPSASPVQSPSTTPTASPTSMPTSSPTASPTETGATPAPTEAGATPSPTKAGATPSPTEAGATPSPTEAGAPSAPSGPPIGLIIGVVVGLGFFIIIYLCYRRRCKESKKVHNSVHATGQGTPTALVMPSATNDDNADELPLADAVPVMDGGANVDAAEEVGATLAVVETSPDTNKEDREHAKVKADADC